MNTMKEKPSIDQRILNEKGPRQFEEMAKILEVGVDVVHDSINRLEKDGYTFIRNEGVFVRSRTEKSGTVFDHSTLFDNVHIRFGVISDTHLGSKQERLDILMDTYRFFRKEGVREVYHCGDLTEGWGVYQGQEFEIHKFGQQEQIDYAVKIYPKFANMTTHFITGNHDLRQYEKGGIDPGKPIASQRKDLKYLGPINAHIMLSSGVQMELLHPGGNQAYALSYKSQRAINNRPPGELPDIMLWGHYHTAFYMEYRGIHFLQAPCTKNIGLWEKRVGLNPVNGGWLVDLRLAHEGPHIERFKPELFTK